MRFRILIFSYAILLIFDGIIFQLLAAERNPVILQPVLFGGITLLMGFMALKQDLQLFAKHAATALSVIAFASSFTYLYKIITNSTESLNYANASNAVMNIFSLIFLLMAVQQFARERKK